MPAFGVYVPFLVVLTDWFTFGRNGFGLLQPVERAAFIFQIKLDCFVSYSCRVYTSSHASTYSLFPLITSVFLSLSKSGRIFALERKFDLLVSDAFDVIKLPGRGNSRYRRIDIDSGKGRRDRIRPNSREANTHDCFDGFFLVTYPFGWSRSGDSRRNLEEGHGPREIFGLARKEPQPVDKSMEAKPRTKLHWR